MRMDKRELKKLGTMRISSYTSFEMNIIGINEIIISIKMQDSNI